MILDILKYLILSWLVLVALVGFIAVNRLILWAIIEMKHDWVNWRRSRGAYDRKP